MPVSYQIEILPPAQKEIRALPGYVRAQAIELIDSLATNPKPSRAKELSGKENIYRIWLAKKWRIVYEINDEFIVVIILRVRLKDEIDYENL
jgi:mRNA interferase RelE/StbE